MLLTMLVTKPFLIIILSLFLLWSITNIALGYLRYRLEDCHQRVWDDADDGSLTELGRLTRAEDAVITIQFGITILGWITIIIHLITVFYL